MQISGKQKLYLGVLGLCVGGFLVDRTILAPDQVAADPPATVAPSAGVSKAAAEMPAAPVEASSNERRHIANRLKAVAGAQSLDPTEVPDAFTPPESWAPDVEGFDEETTDSEPSPADVFAIDHVLTAVMAGANGGYALIDGQMLLVGQTLDGFKLVEVQTRAAVFESETERVTLTLKEMSR